MRCHICKDLMQQDLDSQGRLEWFCLNPDCPTNEDILKDSEIQDALKRLENAK